MQAVISNLGRSTFLPTLVVAAIAMVAIACTTPPKSQFTASAIEGAAPFEVSFVLGEEISGDTFNWDFGDGVSSTEPNPTHTYEYAGTFTVSLRASRGNQIDESQQTITVEPGEAGWIVVTSDKVKASFNETIRFSAEAFDLLGNPVKVPEISWLVDPDVGSIDSEGLLTLGSGLGLFEDSVTAEFSRLGKTVTASTSIEITTGPLEGISIAPAIIDSRVGQSQTIQVEALDAAGHQLEDVDIEFTAIRDGDEVDSAGLFTAGFDAGIDETDLVRVRVSKDGRFVESTITGTVLPGILDQVVVSTPPSTLLQQGEQIQLSARAFDRFGNELELDELVWDVSDPAIGEISPDGLFIAGTIAGTYEDIGIEARGILNRIEAVQIVPLTILPGLPASIEISPSGDSVPIGAGSPFQVYTFDENGNLLDIDEELFEFEYSNAGRGQEKAVFIAGYELGDFEDAIKVTLPTGAAGNEKPITAVSGITIRQRSSNMIAVEVVDQDGGGILLIDLERAQFGAVNSEWFNNGLVEMAPAWWPDGSKLVYVSNPTGELQIYSFDLETREVVQLTDVTGGASMASISPDGTSIAFIGLADENWPLYTAPLGESPVTLEDAAVVSSDPDSQHILPHWSPDGTEILVSQNHSDGTVKILVFDSLGIEEPVVLSDAASITFGWTADGSGIHIGTTTLDGALDLGTVNLAELTVEYLDVPLDFLVAAWAPDDSELIAVDSLLGAGWLVDIDGSGLRRAIESEQLPTRMSWRPREYGDPVRMPEGDGMLTFGEAPRAPVGALDTSKNYSAVIHTDAGQVTVQLFDDDAPLTVENFINLSRTGFYDGLQFHRVISGFVSQGGDPNGDGTGGPGYKFNDEFAWHLKHDDAGILSMANSGSNTNGSQFFITHDAAPWLDAFDNGVKKNCADSAVSCHSVFGKVELGLDIVTGMSERDPSSAMIDGVKIISIEIFES